MNRARSLIDSRLLTPAHWRGRLRRELWGHAREGEAARVAAAFDWLVATSCLSDAPAADIELLRELHDRAVGGRAFRTTGLRAGSHYYPQPAVAAGATIDFLSQEQRTGEAPERAAARAHLELLRLHPFSDGNGRTARLFSTYLLLRAGYRSTLFTNVEQHFEDRPRA